MIESGSAVERLANSSLRLLARFASVTSRPIVSWSRDGTGEAFFREEGELCFSVSFWTGTHGLEGFLIHDEETDVELLVRDIGKLHNEPLLVDLAHRLCEETGITAPTGVTVESSPR